MARSSGGFSLARNHEQYWSRQHFIQRKHRKWIKSKNIDDSGTWANFYRNVCSDASIVLCILNTYSAILEKIERITDVFAKVSFGNRRWYKNTTAGSASHIKRRKSCHLDLKLYIKVIAFSYFSYTLFSVGCFADIAKK